MYMYVLALRLRWNYFSFYVACGLYSEGFVFLTSLPFLYSTWFICTAALIYVDTFFLIKYSIFRGKSPGRLVYESVKWNCCCQPIWMIHILSNKEASHNLSDMLKKTHYPPWIKKARLQCWSSRGQEGSHQRWIWGIHCTQAIYPGFDTKGKCYHKSKTGVPVASKKTQNF